MFLTVVPQITTHWELKYTSPCTFVSRITVATLSSSLDNFKLCNLGINACHNRVLYMTETKSVGHSQIRTRCVTAAMCSKGYFVPRPHICWRLTESYRGAEEKEGGDWSNQSRKRSGQDWHFQSQSPLHHSHSYPGITFTTLVTFSPMAWALPIQ